MSAFRTGSGASGLRRLRARFSVDFVGALVSGVYGAADVIDGCVLPDSVGLADIGELLCYSFQVCIEGCVQVFYEDQVSFLNLLFGLLTT